VQDRYNHDVGQFLKVALMRWLITPSPYGQGHRLGVIRLQESGGYHRLDGDHLAYLHSNHDADEDLRSLDPDLYDRLRLMAARLGRPLTARETFRSLPTDTVRFDRPLRFDDLLRSDRAARVVGRQRWFHEAMVAVAPCSLVFVDSESRLAADGAPQSSSDQVDGGVSMSEIALLLERGQSVVTHQLADPSKGSAELVKAHMTDLHETLGVEPWVLLRSSNDSTRLLTVIAHHRHRSDLQDCVGALQLSRWGDEFRLFRWRPALVTS
jgi:hypothetical protein